MTPSAHDPLKVLLKFGNRKGTGTGELGPDLGGLGRKEGRGPGRPKTHPHPVSDTGELRPGRPELTRIQTSETGYG